jgi:hypothetical protein
VFWAVFQNNAGGAWDIQKIFEAGVLINGENILKGSDAYKAAAEILLIRSGQLLDHPNIFLIKLTC